MRSNSERSFTVGETVHLAARISEPGTKQPVDPAEVVLTALKLGTADVLADPMAYTKVEAGDYSLVLATADLAPGTYAAITRVADGPERVVVLVDEFVLRAAP